MTVTKKYDPLTSSLTAPLAPIQSNAAEGARLLAALNALYEALGDGTAPGASSQDLMGHDHEYEGGWPITKGCVFSVDTGDEHFLSLGSSNGHILGYFPVSPGLGQRNGEHMVLFRYKLYGEKWRIRFGGGEDVELEPFDEGDAPRWAVAYMPIPVLHGWQQVTCGAVRASASATGALVLHGVHVYETANCIDLMGVDPQNVGGSVTNYAYWGSDQRLDEILAVAGDWLDANTMLWLEECINALREYTTDRPRPGSASQYIKGHDHNPSGQGGRPVPRAMVFSAADWVNPLFTLTTGAVNTWHYIDESAGAFRRTDSGSTPGGTATTTEIWRGPVSPGFTSSGSPPSSTPYLTAWINIGDSAGATFEVRVRNLLASAVSATTSGVTAGWIFIDKIPCVGDQWNQFILEIRSTTDSTVDVYLNAIMIAELGYHAGTARTYVASSGGAPLAVANERR
jgi:hypothetical protein